MPNINLFTNFYVDDRGDNRNSGSTSGLEPVYSATNGAWSITTNVFTPTTGDPSATVSVGDFASIFPDAAITTRYVARVTAVSSTTITVSPSGFYTAGNFPATAANGISCRVGGAWAGPSGAEAFPFNLIGSGLRNTSNNPPRLNIRKHSRTMYVVSAGLTPNSRYLVGPVYVEGFKNEPGDTPVGTDRPRIDGSGVTASYSMWPWTSTFGWTLSNLIIGNNGTTGTTDIFAGGTEATYFNVTWFNSRGVVGYGSMSTFISCEAFNCNINNTANRGGFGANAGGTCTFIRCVSHGHRGANSNGWFFANNAGGQINLYECVAYNNSANGIATQNRDTTNIIHCDCVDNQVNGIAVGSPTAGQRMTTSIIGCNLIDNTINGVDVSTAGPEDTITVAGCGFYGNVAGDYSSQSGLFVGFNNYSFGASPYKDFINGDFTLKDHLPIMYLGIFNAGSGIQSPVYGYDNSGAISRQFIQNSISPMIGRVIR